MTCYSSYRKCAKFDLQADLMKLSVEFFYKMMFRFWFIVFFVYLK